MSTVQLASMVLTVNNMGKIGSKIWDKYHSLSKFHLT